MTDEQSNAPDQDKNASALPFAIELWERNGASVERVLARAHSASVARAVFSACENEFPERLLTLREGARELGRSGA